MARKTDKLVNISGATYHELRRRAAESGRMLYKELEYIMFGRVLTDEERSGKVDNKGND